MQKNNINNSKGIMLLSSLIFLIICFFAYLSGRGLIENSFAAVAVTKITVIPKSHIINVGGKISLYAVVEPSNAADKTVKWSSSNTSIATVDNKGLVIGKSAGVVTIIATTSNGKKATSIVTVNASSVTPDNPIPTSSDVLPTEVSINPTLLTIIVGESITINATISPSNVTNKNLIWSSSDSSIAEVNSNGLVTAKKEGKVSVIVKTFNGKTASVAITVIKKEEPSSSKIEEPNSSRVDEPAYYIEPSTHTPDKKPLLNANLKLLIISAVLLVVYVAVGISYFFIKNKRYK